MVFPQFLSRVPEVSCKEPQHTVLSITQSIASNLLLLSLLFDCADLIKVYADWMNPTLTVEEMQVVVQEAHRQKLKVAAHATTAEGIKNAILAGVDSIEHGNHASREDLEMMKARGTFLVLTLGAVYALGDSQMNAAMTPRATADA